MDSVERNQKLAEIKSSIELLEECKQKVMDNEKLDEKAKKDRTLQIDEAIKENYDKARLQFQATKKEVDSMKYNEVSEEYKSKYEERLKKKGLTDEQLHQKEQAVVMVATGEEGTTRKRHRRTKRTEQRDDESGFDPDNIQRLDNEEELMKRSLAKDSKDLERRRHRSAETISDKSSKKDVVDVVGTVIESKKVNPREISMTSVSVDGDVSESKERENKRVLEKRGEEQSEYNFDVSEIPSYVQYDILPLPSNGECYDHKKSRIPVAYLTASDENIIASPNMYRDGNIIDVILKRKILDKDINVEELCKGDRDAIVLWLRATGYGTDYPILARHPKTRKEYQVNVKLDTFKYHPFNLIGDENGYFDYTTENGDLLKFKYLSVKEEDEIKDDIISEVTDVNKFNSMNYLRKMYECIQEMNLEDVDKNELKDCVDDIKDILDFDDSEFDVEKSYTNIITKQMIRYTMSVNGNSDREYIKGYIENMRAKDAFNYRNFVNDNTPGVNTKITINVPQSDGGGSFDTFLGIDDYVFGNI